MFDTKWVHFNSDHKQTSLHVYVADTQRKREQGLMFVKFLPENHGLLFVFPSHVSGGFWMKNTYIPLSIAFVDSGGKIMKLLDMQPCLGEYCPMYHPGVAYQYAIEVNQGWFGKNGIRVGDVVSIN